MLPPTDVQLANIAIPMLFVGWISMVVALLPVIAIETALFATQTGLPWQDVIVSISSANVLSTIIGVPITLILMAIIRREVGAREGYVRYGGLFIPPWRGVTLIFENTSKPLVVKSLLSLLIPSYFVSSLIETAFVSRSIESAAPVWTAVWLTSPELRSVRMGVFLQVPVTKTTSVS